LRPPLAEQALSLPTGAIEALTKAEQLEISGNWYLAGETYSKLEQQFGIVLNATTRSKLFARAGSCFEIGLQARPAARAYYSSAQTLAADDLCGRTAGELFNRSALQHRAAQEYFEAGQMWQMAGRQFAKCSETILTLDDPVHPLPYSGYRAIVTAYCYLAAGEAFIDSSDHASHACGAFWDAGNA
jgi:hypothetical protein